jgi:hypothetical protein
MSDYSQGKIYMLTSKQTPEVYIGSTKETLEDRKIKHTSDYKRWLEGKTNYMTSYEICKYDDYEIQLVEEYPCNTEKELRKKEGEYQRMMDCVNKRIECRTNKEYYEDNKQSIIEQHKEYQSIPEVKQKTKEYKKEYWKKNKDKYLEGMKKSYLLNRDDRLKQMKEYREKNKQKINCVCGGTYTKPNKSTHYKSVKHSKYIEEMKEKGDTTNINEFFEQLTTN